MENALLSVERRAPEFLPALTLEKGSIESVSFEKKVFFIFVYGFMTFLYVS